MHNFENLSDNIHRKKEYTYREYLNGYQEQIQHISTLSVHVQSFVNNITAPSSIEELRWFIYEHSCFNIEDILTETEVSWTAPKWAKPGDIVFFMHGKQANKKFTAMRSELLRNKTLYSDYDTLIKHINHGLQLHKQYGGRIFAIAMVSGFPEYEKNDWEEDEFQLHWGSRLYANMNNVYVLDNPIHISEFNQFIKISRCGALTPVYGKEYEELKKLLKSKNKLPQFFLQRDATPLPLARINAENWLALSNEYRRSFGWEQQFRSFYVDYLLHSLSDRKTIYRECRCTRKDIFDSFIDNVIYIGKYYLPVEVKLSVSAEENIKGQVSKYCYNDKIYLNKDRVIGYESTHKGKVLIIDTEYAFLYDYKTDKLTQLFELDHLKSINDIAQLKQIILSRLQ